MMSDAQELLEAWWNEDPEMRWVEILCGDKLRVCVRLYEVTTKGAPEVESDDFYRVGEAEAGTLEDAIRAAVVKAREATA